MRLRRGSGVREGDLVKRASSLRESVDPLLPRLTEECPTEKFDRLRAALERIREARDESRRLDRFSRWGDPLARAYAGLLRFYLDPKLPEVVVAPFPGGSVSFVPLGRAPREAQIAVQQSDDPRRLLLGYLAWARKGYHFFATSSTLFCTGRSPAPPAEFLSSQIALLPYRLIEHAGGDRWDCTHLSEGMPLPYLAVGWLGAHTTLRVCRRCTKEDRQLLAGLTSGLAVPKPETAFPVSTSLNVTCQDKPECIHQRLPPLSRALRKRYLFGRLSDAQLSDGYRGEVKPRLDSVTEPVYVAGGVCYGSNLTRFVEALHPTTSEKRALEQVLPDHSGLFEIETATASKALERLWHDHAETIVKTIVPDPEQAQRLVKEARAAPGRISELLRRAEKANQQQEVLDSLPQYERLSPEATYVDSVARTYRTQGDSAAERLLLQSMPKEGKERGIAFGFLLALKRNQSHSWQFSETEKEFGASLAERAGEVLVAPPDRYHEALSALFGAAGVPTWGVRSQD